MNVEQIRKKLAGGFRPLVIRTSDGREFKVPHPEFIAVGRFEVAVVDPGGEMDLLDPLHIVSIRSLARPNGSAKGAGRR